MSYSSITRKQRIEALLRESLLELDILVEFIEDGGWRKGLCLCGNNGGGDCDYCQMMEHARAVLTMAKKEGIEP